MVLVLYPPGFGIVHQVNLEYLAKGVLSATGSISPYTGREPIRIRR